MSRSETSPAGVSVIIPAYNYARYLPSAVDSVLRQDYPRVEIIVVDDGSTDSSRAILSAYGSKLHAITQPHRGVSAARNNGIRAARYPFVAFLDADDMWKPGLLTRLMTTLRCLMEDFGLVACLQELIDSDGRPIPRKPQRDAKLRDREITFDDLLLKSRFGTSSVLVDKSCFEQCGYFDESLQGSEDRDMWLRIASRRRLYLVTELFSLVRRHSASATHNPLRMKEDATRVLQKALHGTSVKRSSWSKSLRSFSFLRFEVAWMYSDVDRPGSALTQLLCSLLLWPWFEYPAGLNEPLLFRVRSLRLFLRQYFRQHFTDQAHADTH